MQVNSWLPFVIFNLQNVERKGKIQKLEYLEKNKSFFDEIKKILKVFEGLSFGKKKKNKKKTKKKKILDTSFNAI